MEIPFTTYIVVCPMVFMAGFMDSIAGGGGLISLPTYLLAGVPIHNALATNKLSSTMGAIISAFRYWRHSFVNVAFIMPSVAAAFGGSVLGAKLALLTDEKYLRALLFVLLPVIAFFVLKRKTIGHTGAPLPRRQASVRAVIISLAVGTYDGLYGPGCGTFLMLLYAAFCRMDVRNATGNTRFVNLASNVGALTLFLLNGKALVALGLTAGVFSIAGSWLGAGLAIKKGSAIVRPVVLVVLCLLFLKVVVGGG